MSQDGGSVILTELEERVLRVLKKTRLRMTIQHIAGCADVEEDRHRVGEAVKRLERLGYVRFPKGPRSGVEITTKGEERLAEE